MAKYKRQKVKRYRRSFYSRGTRIKKGIGIVVLVLAVLGAAWLAAPHVLDWATHTWYTVVKNRDLEAESASRAAASSEAAASSAVQEAASSQPEPEQPKELDGKAVTGGSWAAVDVSTLADDAAIRAAAQQLKAQGADYGLVTLKDADGSIHYASQVAAASGSVAGTAVDPARIAAQVVSGISFLGAGVIFKNGNSIRGLTTAAGMWGTSAIGMAIGAGMYWVGLITTVIMMVAQVVLHRFPVAGDAAVTQELAVSMADTPELHQALTRLLNDHGGCVTDSALSRDDVHIAMELTVRLAEPITYQEALRFMQEHPGVERLSV